MIQISSWTDSFIQALDARFGSRVWFVGLQGSYSRGEATENSDIDMVVILDDLTAVDLKAYSDMLDTLEHRELICGFLAGKAQLLHWESSDLFQFYYDTTPLKGSLDELPPLLDAAAVRKAIQTGVCNIYHGSVHNMLYEKSEDILKGLYKAASFVLQAICFRQTGRYFCRQSDLLTQVSPQDRAIAETFIHLKNGGEVDFVPMSEALFAWAANRIEQTP